MKVMVELVDGRTFEIEDVVSTGFDGAVYVIRLDGGGVEMFLLHSILRIVEDKAS